MDYKGSEYCDLLVFFRIYSDYSTGITTHRVPISPANSKQIQTGHSKWTHTDNSSTKSTKKYWRMLSTLILQLFLCSLSFVFYCFSLKLQYNYVYISVNCLKYTYYFDLKGNLIPVHIKFKIKIILWNKIFYHFFYPEVALNWILNTATSNLSW